MPRGANDTGRRACFAKANARFSHTGGEDRGRRGGWLVDVAELVGQVARRLRYQPGLARCHPLPPDAPAVAPSATLDVTFPGLATPHIARRLTTELFEHCRLE